MCWSGQAPPEKLIQYSMSLPVAAAVIGMPKVEHIEQNIAVGQSLQADAARRDEDACPANCRRRTSWRWNTTSAIHVDA